jgi:TPR repeat protein
MPRSHRSVKAFCVALLLLSITIGISAQSIAIPKRQAAAGDAKAQCNLGVAYYNGDGVPKDEAEAIRWFRKAADQGYAEAQFNLGVAYDFGNGVPKDEVEAVRWYRKAADQGHAKAQYNLGVAYRNGDGVAEDSTEAIRWYRKAADQGHADAQYNLGVAYHNGNGVPQSYAEAYFWLNIAAESNSGSQGDIARLRDKEASYLGKAELLEMQERARKWLESHPPPSYPVIIANIQGTGKATGFTQC